MGKVEQVKTDKFSFWVFEDIFDDSELDRIWQEALFLCYPEKLGDPYETSSATNKEGIPIKSNSGIWLDLAYNKRILSNYLSLYRKPIVENDILSRQCEDFNLRLLSTTNFDNTLMNYYETGDYYDSHIDIACYTYVFWLFVEPKMFSGGDLVFTDVDYKLNVKSNMGVLFPSWALHEVESIQMSPMAEGQKGLGRFSFSTFFAHGKG